MIKKRVFYCVLPFAATAAAVLAAWFALRFVSMPECMVHKLTGWYCPGCGNTRAVIALLQGDVLLSLRQNVAIALAIVTGALLYVEPVMKAFGKSDFRSPVRSYKFLWTVLALLAVYYVVRNFVPQIAPIPI
jgi:hypothetical protein